MDVEVADVVAAQGDIANPPQPLKDVFERLFPRGVHCHLHHIAVAPGRDRQNLAQPAVPNPLGNFDVHRVGRHLVIDEETEFLLRRLLGGGLDRQAAGDVDGHGLGHVDVATGVDGGLGLFGIEIGDVFDGDGFDPAIQKFLVSREAGESSTFLDAQGVAAFIDGVLEIVGQGVDFIAAIFLEEVGDPGPAASAADHAKFDLSSPRPGPDRQRQVARRSPGPRSRRRSPQDCPETRAGWRLGDLRSDRRMGFGRTWAWLLLRMDRSWRAGKAGRGGVERPPRMAPFYDALRRLATGMRGRKRMLIDCCIESGSGRPAEAWFFRPSAGRPVPVLMQTSIELDLPGSAGHNGQHEDLSVAHAAGPGDLDDCPHDLFHPHVLHPKGDLHLGQIGQRILTAAILVEIALLAAVPLDLADAAGL